MQNLTQFNPNKNTQVISSQVLAEYFSNHDEPLELEKTSQGFLLNIPQSFFNKQALKKQIEEQSIRQLVEQAYGMVTVDTTGQDFDLMSFDVYPSVVEPI